MMDGPHIVVKFNMAIIKDIPLEGDELSIGRKSGNDVVLDNQAVSGSHCKIRKEGDGYVIVDMDSTNGTYVNGRKITREKLKHKDMIRIARYGVDFLWEAKAYEAHAQAMNPELKVIDQVEATPAPQEIAPPPTVGAEEKLPYGVAPKASEPPSQIGANLKGDRPLPAPSGVVKIISGGEGQSEVRLTELMTYIGTGTQALIKIKGFMAPELAAAISRRPDGYFLKAVKAGYPKVNGVNVQDQIFLESGALIEVGGTNMVFYVDDPKKKG